MQIVHYFIYHFLFTPSVEFSTKTGDVRLQAAGRFSHLAPTLSARLVAVKVEALVSLTVTGAAGLVSPAASGTWEVGPVGAQVKLDHTSEVCSITHTV